MIKYKPMESPPILLFQGLDPTGKRFALPVDRVTEVADVPATITPLPHFSNRIAGIAAINGQLVPILSQAEQSGSDQAVGGWIEGHGDEATALILVRDATGGNLGLLARRLGGVRDGTTAISRDELSQPQGTLVARLDFEDGPVWLLDPDRLFCPPPPQPAAAAHTALPDPSEPGIGRRTISGSMAPSGVQVLLVEGGGQRHAMPFDDLLLVDNLTSLEPLPHTPAALLGISLVRKVPLPVVDVFGTGSTGMAGLAVIIAHPAGPVALPVARLNGLARVDDPISPIDLIDRLVPDLARWSPQDGEAAEERLRGARRHAPSPHHLLPLTVDGRTYGLAMKRVHRILPIPLVTNLPFHPSRHEHQPFHGLAEMEGALLPVIDLGRNLGTTVASTRNGDDTEPDDRISRSVTVIAETGGGRVALLVDRIGRPKRIAPPLWTAMPGPLVIAMAILDDHPVPALGSLLEWPHP